MSRPDNFVPFNTMASHMLRNARRFDEYLRCYPVAMLPGADRPELNHGGKIILPPSALDKLTRLHIMYPMLFELKNNKLKTSTHAGVLEFIAEEGKIYLPQWIMETLVLEPGDLVNITSTELPLGTFVKFQPQDVSFLEISDPKAVLQRALNNLSTLTKGDIFTFDYNDTIYRIAVLETKPESPKNAICIIDVDLNVDFAPPIGYEEPKRTSGTSTPRSNTSGIPSARGGMIHPEGTMSQSINYSSIAPKSSEGGAAKAVGSSNFVGAGNRVAARKGKATTTSSTKSSTPEPEAKQREPRGDAPYPLRLAPGKLFLGYEIKPHKKKDGETAPKEPVHFQGQGNTLRKKKKGEE